MFIIVSQKLELAIFGYFACTPFVDTPKLDIVGCISQSITINIPWIPNVQWLIKLLNPHVHPFSAIHNIHIWRFPKIHIPQIIHVTRIFHYKPSILGIPNFKKPPILKIHVTVAPFLQCHSRHGTFEVVVRETAHADAFQAIKDLAFSPEVTFKGWYPLVN